MARTWWGLALLCAACGGDPAIGPTGYQVTVTPGSNGCLLASWSGAASTASLLVTVTGAEAQMVIGGATGAYLRGEVGDDVLVGTASGSALDVQLAGSAQQQMGYCTYTVDAHVTGALAGSGAERTFTGALVLDTANRGPDCGGEPGTFPPAGCTSTATLAP